MSTAVSPYHILIVDDVPFQCAALKMVLDREFNNGITCDTVETGEGAVQKNKEARYDLVIMDYNLTAKTAESKSGADFTKIILEGIWKPCIVGFTTDSDSVEVVEDCLKKGMKTVLPKDWVKVRDFVRGAISEKGLIGAFKNLKTGDA